tara:strand:+ start:452 stop:685 length:234 start_codon:yes stop_codon:yes gene_type:complete
MAMAKLELIYKGEPKTYYTDDFNDVQMDLYRQAGMAEQELNRYNYFVKVLEDRKTFCLTKLVESIEEEPKEDAKEET